MFSTAKLTSSRSWSNVYPVLSHAHPLAVMVGSAGSVIPTGAFVSLTNCHASRADSMVRSTIAPKEKEVYIVVKSAVSKPPARISLVWVRTMRTKASTLSMPQKALIPSFCWRISSFSLSSFSTTFSKPTRALLRL